MVFIATQYREDFRTGKRIPLNRFLIRGETRTECFEQMYANERSARYCSGYSYEFNDSDMDAAYRKWRENSVTVLTYYGNGTVD